MAQVTRPASYSGSIQRFIVGGGIAGVVDAYLWGAGGGGGGADGGRAGGTGQGGSYSKITLSVSPGDIIDVAPGQGGQGGGSNQGRAPGGYGGASYTPGTIFDSRIAVPNSGATLNRSIRVNVWPQFVNQHAVWNQVPGLQLFDESYTINVAVAGTFIVTAIVYPAGQVLIDGSTVLESAPFPTPAAAVVYLSAGTHTVRLLSTVSGQAFACTIVSSDSGYSGAPGGYAGGSGSSGGGGGGGGASVLLLNGSVVAVAGGGGGGGGAGVRSASGSGSAPGPRGRAAPGTNIGEEGQTQPGDGGAGGGGGGGYGGGNGGYYGNGDIHGEGGTGGGNLGTTSTLSTGQAVANAGSPYIFGSVGNGGTVTTYSSSPGGGGQITLAFDVVSSYIKNSGSWQPVQQIYVKNSGVWQPVQAVYVKQSGVWNIIAGTDATAPTFSSQTWNYFGVSYRPYVPPTPPDPGYTG